jgi:hypothetical protein
LRQQQTKDALARTRSPREPMIRWPCKGCGGQMHDQPLSDLAGGYRCPKSGEPQPPPRDEWIYTPKESCLLDTPLPAADNCLGEVGESSLSTGPQPSANPPSS